MTNPLDALNQLRRQVTPDIDLDQIRNPKPNHPDPLDTIPESDNTTLEEDCKNEFKAIKKAFQKQDQNQKNQFANLYDGHWYYTDVYPTQAHCEYALALQNRILAVNHEKMGEGFYRNGKYLIKAYEALAKELDIDINDIPKP